MKRAAVTGLAALVVRCGLLLFVPRLHDARPTVGALLARFGVLVGMASEDLTFRSTDVSLSGTIVFPEQSQPVASVVLVHGSGSAHRMLWLARLFDAEGLAVLTYDKRGVGRSGGQFQGGPSRRPHQTSIFWRRMLPQPPACWSSIPALKERQLATSG